MRLRSNVPPIPSRRRLRLAHIGEGDYLEIGREFLEHFVTLGDLKPTDAVLEIGCGLGRMASALSTYLAPPGYYEGFDVSTSNIRWCARHIHGRHANFRFSHVSVRNSMYNRRGAVPAEEFSFPYHDGQFTFVIATSVFTHMLPDGVVRYLAEGSRVLKSAGTYFATFFLASEPLLHTATESFPHDRGMHRLNRLDMPEAVVAYDKTFLLSAFDNVGLTPSKHFRGQWSGEREYVSYQDIIVGRKWGA